MFEKISKFLLIFTLITVWIFSGWPKIWENPRIPPKIQEAWANTTGEEYPTLGESIKENPWGDAVWTTPTNIYSDDGNTASVTSTQFDDTDQTRVLKATGFDFSAIPDGSNIDGVIVRVNSWYGSGQGSGSMDLLQLLDTSKAKVGTNQCLTPVALTTDDTTIITKGNSADKWGNVLTAAWVKNANFGVAIGIIATADNADVYVDYVTIEIYFTPPSLSITAPASAEMSDYQLGGVGYSDRNFKDASALVQVTATSGFTVTVSSTAFTGVSNTIAASDVKLMTDGTVGTDPTTIENCSGFSGVTETSNGEYALDSAQTIVTTTSGTGTCDIYPTIRVYIDDGLFVEQDTGILTFTVY